LFLHLCFYVFYFFFSSLRICVSRCGNLSLFLRCTGIAMITFFYFSLFCFSFKGVSRECVPRFKNITLGLPRQKRDCRAPSLTWRNACQGKERNDKKTVASRQYQNIKEKSAVTKRGSLRNDLLLNLKKFIDFELV